MNALVYARGLMLGYGRKTVLSDVTLDVHPGQFWCLVGRNGEGKTTLINALLGLLRPQKGSITRSPALNGLKGVGFVPQRCDLTSTVSTTVREFVLLGLAGCRILRAQQSERLTWALRQVGLEKENCQDYWALSGGQRQRALVARALIRKPQLLVLDEAVAGLDFPIEQALLSSLQTLQREEELTVMLVTHDITTAPKYATHIAVFYDGTVRTGTRDEILEGDHLNKAFGQDIRVQQEIADLLNSHAWRGSNGIVEEEP